MEKNDNRRTNDIAKKINQLFNHLKKGEDLVVVPTDKTNSNVLISASFYSNRTRKHLIEEGIKTTKDTLMEVKEESFTKLEAFRDLLSESEYNYVKSTINNCNVPTVKLLIKDHKKQDEHGEYPSRLVVPAIYSETERLVRSSSSLTPSCFFLPTTPNQSKINEIGTR